MRTPTPFALPTQPITRANLLAQGVTPRMLRTRIVSGDVVQIRRGVYVGARSWPPDAAGRHILSARAEQAMHPLAIISHGSAALAHGLPTPGFDRWEDGPISLTVPGRGDGFRTATVVHHTGPLPTAHVQRDQEGYLVTTPARTAVDLASARPFPEALVLLDSVARTICARMVSQVRRSDYSNPRLAGAALDFMQQAAATVRATRLRSAFALVNPARESVAESLSAAYIYLAHLPAPRVQAEIRTPLGRLYPDLLWDEQLLIGEVDGAVKYQDANAYVLEKEREQVLRDLGYRVVRWLAKEIMLTPDVVVDRIARSLAR